MQLDTRRDWLLRTASLATGACLVSPSLLRSAPAPAFPVAVGRCKTYDPSELLPALTKLFDQLGGLGRLVKGKTVAIKINLTGAPTSRLGHHPLGDTHYTNPQVIAATVHLMGRAGATRIRVVESASRSSDALSETLFQANWEPRDIVSAAPKVEFVNTNSRGSAKKYSHFKVPYGGYLYPSWELNQAYEECDVFVSLAKLKEHETTGITLSMKNCFGMTPCSVYGADAGIEDPNESPRGGRSMLHSGNRQPAKNAAPEKDTTTPRTPGYRVPRAVTDLIGARPIHLAIIEGIRTMSGGEGPWAPKFPSAIQPGVLVAGTNPVNTDAVAMSVMGYDPMADRGTAPFETSVRQGPIDNMLRLAEDAGLGTRDLKRIEVVGTPIKEALFDFAAVDRAQIAANGGVVPDIPRR